ncbi:MAG TPA: GntG family PLP-dependent aldolase [Stellaceae bacterium]|nr:GntG family PLP-dependent aldolase [Stellaceae bacterium]
MDVIDLGSDTVTRPTERMLERMRNAELGDDGREGDPTVRALETLAAKRLGKEAGLFMPSGTMANLVSLLAHTGRGGEVLSDAGTHIFRSEMGGVAGLASLFHRAIPAKRGVMDLDALRENLRPALTPRSLFTALIVMETTHNDGGGAVLPLDYMAAVHRLANENGIPVHIDGARLFNAAVKLGVPVSAITAHGESACFCISKGLSAPVGSLLCGSTEFILRARAFRRMCGGNLRQAGVIAAAGIVSLEEMVDRLAEDHTRAKRLAEGLARVHPSLVDPALVETNIVRVDFEKSGRRAEDWVKALNERGIRAGAWSPWQIRLVTHRHVTDADVERVVGTMRELWGN